MNKARFKSLWQSACLDEARDVAGAVYAELDKHYGHTDRHYHSWRHIKALLNMFDEVKQYANCPVAMELAIWFHDVIYSTRAKNNERLSADLFMQRSEGVLKEDIRERVERLIMATEYAAPGSLEQSDEQLLTDIDLLSFASDRESFLKDTADIRKEFQDVPDQEYYPSQVRFLSALQQRASFYSSQYFRQLYEVKARENLSHLLGLLAERGYR